MSTSEPQEVAFAQTLWLISNYAILSANTMWLMDFLYTLPMEWRAIWSKNLMGTSILFLLNRYLFFGYMISVFIENFDLSGVLSCNLIFQMQQAFQIASIQITNILFTLRVYAISGQKKTDASLATGLSTKGSIYESLSPCGLSIPDAKLDAIHIQSWQRDAPTGTAKYCATSSSRWYKDLEYHISANKAHLYQLSPTNSVFQGLMGPYFTAQATFDYGKGEEIFNADNNQPLSLPNLLITRLVLNLRLFDQAPNAPSSGHLPDLDFVQNRILGNIGAPLDHSQWDSLMDEGVEGEQDVEQYDIGNRTENEVNTMVPVIYGEESEAIQMVAITRDV
ncbi:uncharacterized protein STEHIDRAFT_116583 [Stereum hirsutum FP-91666 SS1]|uniref:DUF6533 domain-containing protein n=1 Tax=Stereum hirsutum (strain FP-91666) TaxID=721885 RepID=R7RX48_STEHR|nr:uncharacterized protein STEHIDRAFT_116583 [Stereum hirsutum FP-91666 SS1]EIM79388.1 hypothetical protein STEHIDRAFT_116583 [Stereum hirsutum FP-91666 SS1]